MRRLGISIYPEKDSLENIVAYIKKAGDSGFLRIFSCLLSVNKSKEEIIHDFREINLYAKSLGFEIIVDVSPAVFSKLDISYKDLGFFNEIGADGLRLDIGFTGLEESLMTFNEYGLKIEINMSNDVSAIDTVMNYEPNRYNLYGCHNFYPHNYSGLGLDFFKSCTNRFKKYGLNTAAFITTRNAGSFGPWPTDFGLPSLEMHRNMGIDKQLKHMIALGDIDDIIISNCYPSDEELEKIKCIPLDRVCFDVELLPGLPKLEKNIVLNEMHFNRGDKSENFIRSTASRVKYKGERFEVINPSPIKIGDIIIESSLYGHYAGELQIALSDMENSGMSSVVGHIDKNELFLLDYIRPWQKFAMKEAKIEEV